MSLTGDPIENEIENDIETRTNTNNRKIKEPKKQNEPTKIERSFEGANWEESSPSGAFGSAIAFANSGQILSVYTGVRSKQTQKGVYVSIQLQSKPLSRLQAYLVELKTCIGLLREVLLEFKELLVVVVLILFFTLGVYEALVRLLNWVRRRALQT
jgi:hypothetical protein